MMNCCSAGSSPFSSKRSDLFSSKRSQDRNLFCITKGIPPLGNCMIIKEIFSCLVILYMKAIDGVIEHFELT